MAWKEETYSVLVGKPEGQSPLELSGVGCENITEIEWNVVEQIYLAECLVLVQTAIKHRVLKMRSGLLK
jgi:hypothetical protein